MTPFRPNSADPPLIDNDLMMLASIVARHILSIVAQRTGEKLVPALTTFGKINLYG